MGFCPYSTRTLRDVSSNINEAEDSTCFRSFVLNRIRTSFKTTGWAVAGSAKNSTAYKEAKAIMMDLDMSSSSNGIGILRSYRTGTSQDEIPLTSAQHMLDLRHSRG